MYYLSKNAVFTPKAILPVLHCCIQLFNSVYIVNHAYLLGFSSKNSVFSLLRFLHQGQSRVVLFSTTVQV